MQKTEPLSDQYFEKKRNAYKKSAISYKIFATACFVFAIISMLYGGIKDDVGIFVIGTFLILGNIFLILSIIYSLHQDRLRENQKICNLLEEIKRDGDIQL